MWFREEILATIEGEVCGILPDEFSDVSIDSRTLKPSAIFFAIEGDNFDGHSFLKAAVQQGAGLLIIQKDKRQKAENIGAAFIAVEDVLQALELLAKQSRQRCAGKIVAITGSVGKTTLKELLKSALENFGKTHASPASFNNHWGVPLSLATMPRDTQYGVFELGMNHCGELAQLSAIVQPDISIITAIAPAHLGHFKSIADIAAAKAEIYTAQRKAGLALLNIDDEFCRFLSSKAHYEAIEHIGFFGYDKAAQYRIVSFKEKLLRYSVLGTSGELSLAIERPSAAYNAMAVVGVLDFLNLELELAEKTLTQFQELGGRGKEHQLNLPKQAKAILVDESYNANPHSMANALTNLANKKIDKDSRKIAVLGDMLEMGSFANDMHMALVPCIKAAGLAKLYLVGEHMRHIAPLFTNNTVWATNVSELLPIILEDIKPGDIIMVKSSKTVGTNQVVNELLNRYALKSSSI